MKRFDATCDCNQIVGVGGEAQEEEIAFQTVQSLRNRDATRCIKHVASGMHIIVGVLEVEAVWTLVMSPCIHQCSPIHIGLPGHIS